jgi:hypothetical protein
VVKEQTWRRLSRTKEQKRKKRGNENQNPNIVE